MFPGTRLGPYQILAPLGSGGMGEVFKARDTRLDRLVAIKVLPPEFANDPGRRERLHREAKMVSQFNHANICALYDAGRDNGTDYLVMEYLDGHTLADRLTRGRLPLDEVLRYGAEIALALDPAHRHGIVHRDLKPSNVMLTRSGVKLLDFGLARMTSPASGAQTDTAQKPLTEEGALVGTVPYMAPEQVEGKPVDHRTDIFAFGAVLYEMATGRRAFQGESHASIISAILTTKPPALSTLLPFAPRDLEHVIAKCLEKNPEERWQSAFDVAEQLRWMTDRSEPRVVPSTGERRWKFAGLLLTVTLLAAAFALHIRGRSDDATREPIRFVIKTPENSVFAPPTQRPFSVSPDGKHLTFVTLGGGLWMRPLGSSATLLPGTQGARTPFWSPDGRILAFYQDQEIRKLPIAGGPTETICPADVQLGASWGSRGKIVFANRSGVYHVSADGGTPERVLPWNSDRMYVDPVFLPDGDHYLITVFDGHRRPSIRLRQLSDGSERLLLRNAANAAWSEPGQMLFVRGEVLLAQSFDLNTFELSGEPEVVSETIGVMRRESLNALFSVSRDGRILALQPTASNNVRLVHVNWKGDTLAEVAGPARIWNPRVSHDGLRVACMIEDTTGDSDIWTVDVSRGVMTRLTQGPAQDGMPTWSPDDRYIAYASDGDIYRIRSSGGVPELVLSSPLGKAPTDWSPDGETILYREGLNPAAWDIKALRLSDRNIHTVAASPFSDDAARFSPDGQWVAYQSLEAGVAVPYVQRFPDAAVKLRVANRGEGPQWNRDGTKIYTTAPFVVMDVTYESGAVRFSTPRPMLERPAKLNNHTITIMPDGSGVIGRRHDEMTVNTQIEVLIDWVERFR